MAQNRFYSSIAPPTTLASSLAGSGNPSVTSITGLPTSYPYTVLIDWGLSTQEAISVTSAPTGTGPYTLPCTRGIDGTSAQSHNTSAIVVHGVTAEDYNEPQVHMATGTSGASYPNVIHGLANGSAVVGTTDSQTLSNKTLAATTFTGDLTVSTSEATTPVVQITNTHATPAAAILRVVANAAADSSLALRVTGDTVNRWQVDSNGKHQWGPGASTAVDTNLYRNGVGLLQSDGQIQAASLTASESAAAGNVLSVVNTHSAPTGANVALTAQAAADTQVGNQVTGDTNYRQTIDSNGKISWGSGAAGTDTDLYRGAAGVLSTDNTVGALAGVQAGATTPAFGAGTGGIIGITNATAAPSAASISGGLALYSGSGNLKWMNSNGMLLVAQGSQAANNVTLANSTTETAISSFPVTANDPANGSFYFMEGMGIVSTTGSPTITWKVRWGGVGGTQLVTTAAITQGTGVTNLPFMFSVKIIFTSSTQCMSSLNLNYQTAAGTTLTQNYQQTTSVTTVTTNSNQTLVLSATWSAASASNTLTSWYSPQRIS